MWKERWRLFVLGLWLGSTIFGGVAQAFPVIRRKAVELGWLEGEEVDGLYAVAVFLPGPSFLNLWGIVANRVAGFPGALLAQVGLILPAFLLVIGLPLLAHFPLLAARTGGALAGATWATAGLLLATGVSGVARCHTRFERWTAGAVLALLLLGVHPLLLLVLAVGAGVALVRPGGAQAAGGPVGKGA